MKSGFYGAPAFCAVFAQEDFLYGIPDAFCCAQNMVLMAAEPRAWVFYGPFDGTMDAEGRLSIDVDHDSHRRGGGCDIGPGGLVLLAGAVLLKRKE